MKSGIVVYGGFTETEGRPTGQDALQRELDSLYDNRDDVEVYDLRPWKQNPKHLAELLVRDKVDQAILIGYSWGGGYGVQRLAEELQKRNVTIPLMLLCDPVYRPLWLPPWKIANILAPRALTSTAKIKVPVGVDAVKGIRQEFDKPSGHSLKWRGKTIVLPEVTRPGVCHTNIDGSHEWWKLVLPSVAEIIGKS